MAKVFLNTLIVLSLTLVNALGKNQLLAKKKYSTYTVRKGDNLSTIAELFGVSVSKLCSWNDITRKKVLFVGKRLRVKGRVTNSSDQRIRIQKPIYSRVFRRYRNSRYNKNLGLVYRVQRAKTVRAAHSGRIVKVSTMRGYGNYILVDHGKGWVSMYSNMSQVFVRPGQRIRMRSKLGSVKNTEFFFLLSFRGRPIDPNRYF